MLVETGFQDCVPLLKKLWPHQERIAPIDNTNGLIEYLGDEYESILAKYFLWVLPAQGAVGTTHAYTTGSGRLRIRGTWIDEKFRKTGIGRKLIEGAIAAFPRMELIHTFPREGTESFYRRLGFSFPEKMRYTPAHPHGYTYAERRLSQ